MVCEQITTAEKLCCEIDVAVVLEEAVVVQSEGVLDPLENKLFVLNMIDVLARDNLRLFHSLDGVLFVRIRLDPAHLDVTEGT